MDQTETTPERPLTRRELRAREAAAADGGAPAPDERAPDEQAPDERAPDEQSAVQPVDEQVADEQVADEQADVPPPSGPPGYDPRTGGPGAADETMELPLSALGLDEEEGEAHGEGEDDRTSAHDGPPTEGTPHDQAPAAKAPADDTEAGVPTPPRPWDLAVGWSLRQELPKELPPEPDVDDVRWEPAPAEPMGAQEAEALGTEAIAGRPVDVAPQERSSAPGQAEASGDEPGPEEAAHGTSDEVPSGSSAAASPGASRFSGWPGPAMGVGHAGGPGWSSFPPVASDVSTASAEPEEAPAPGVAGRDTAAPEEAAALPTLTDLLAARPAPPAGPAELGWQATVRRLTGGLVAPAPGRAEQAHRAAVAAVQRSLEGPKTVVVLNPKGGAHKTTATLLIAATFGLHRGGYTLAWDNNETRGTLGWRSQQSRHHNTALNLLQDLDRFADPSSARVGDLDNYVRSQGSAQFDVLASDEDAASAASIDAFAFRSLHRTLSRFYRVMVIDTGNNMRASNWQAAVEAADQVVIVSTVREDTAQSAAWAVDALRATGHEDVVRRAVTVLSAPAPQRDDRLADRLHEHFGRLTRTVLDVPYDPSLVAGRPLDYDALSRHTREAWLQVTAAVADGL